jgi:hypothetical protein
MTLNRFEFYDWPLEPGLKRRVEVLAPEPEPRRIEITVRHHGRLNPQAFIMVLVIAFVVIMLVRAPLAIIMLAALVGWQMIAAFLVMVAALAVAAWREHRAARPF